MNPSTPDAKSRSPRPPVLILGAHRSGTTATARALELLGLQIGQGLDSHHESKALQSLHEKYLQRLGAAWHRPGPFLEWMETSEGERDCLEYLRKNTHDDFRRLFGYRNNPRDLWLFARLKLGAAWGWKEPRTTLFAPMWLRLFPDARVLEVIRHPLAVATSIRQRELQFRAGGDPPTPGLDQLDYCLRLALNYVELGGRLVSLTPHYRRIRFEDIQANPDHVLDDLAGFCDLHPTRPRLVQAAASIRPASSRWRDDLPDETARQLLSSHPLVERLGYN
jgi:hypothetical protein